MTVPALSALPAVTSVPPGEPSSTYADLLESVSDHWRTYISTAFASGIDLLTLYAAHTHFVGAGKVSTSPRLLLESPVPESGKTTVLEHLERLCHRPVMLSSATPAVLPRLLVGGPRTLLLDEIDKNLKADRDDLPDILVIVNTGYRKGGKRVVVDKQTMAPVELPTFAPFVMAGIAPNLPDDTLSRTIRVLLLPDTEEGTVSDSDWDLIEDATLTLGTALVEWAESGDLPDPDLPDGVRGRIRERWKPLWRVAHLAGGRWPQVVRDLIDTEREDAKNDREEGTVKERTPVHLLRDIVTEWPPGEPSWGTAHLCAALSQRHPLAWGVSEKWPKGLTPQRVGKMLRGFGLRTAKDSSGQRLGYLQGDVAKVCRRFGMPTPGATEVTAGNADTDERVFLL